MVKNATNFVLENVFYRKYVICNEFVILSELRFFKFSVLISIFNMDGYNPHRHELLGVLKKNVKSIKWYWGQKHWELAHEESLEKFQRTNIILTMLSVQSN